MGHICSAFVRGFAHDLRPINSFISGQLTVIADQFDGYMDGYYKAKGDFLPYEQRALMDRFVAAYTQWHELAAPPGIEPGFSASKAEQVPDQGR